MKANIKAGIEGLFYVWRSELKTIFGDKAVLMFFFLVPILYPILYTLLYNGEVVRNVPVVVVDQSHTPLSRDFIRKLDATAEVGVVGVCADMKEAEERLKNKEAYSIYFISKEFSSDLAHGRQTLIKLFSDMSGLMYYKNSLIAATNVSLVMNKQIKIERGGQYTARQEQILSAPIAYEDVALFNPQSGFASFLIPAVLILIIQQTLLLGVGLSAGTSRENNRFQSLIPTNKHFSGTLRVLMGKGLAYFMIYVVVALYVLCFIPYLFALNHIGHFSTLLLFGLPFLSSCVLFAMTASVFIRNRENCLLIFVWTSVPLLFISGISWPGSAIPDFWKYVSYIFPSTPGINGFVRINNMGGTLSDVGFEYKLLWIQTGVYFVCAFFVYRWQILNARKKAVQHYLELKNNKKRKIVEG